MRLSFPTLRQLPSVRAALTWLLAELENGDADILAAARLRGLILSEDGPHWKVDGEVLARLTEDAIARLPHDPDKIGEILHGIGEMGARSHAPTLSTLFVNYLKTQRSKVSLLEVLDGAIKCDTAIRAR
jgi:hypothetical protein